jgi:hypothetical protein
MQVSESLVAINQMHRRREAFRFAFASLPSLSFFASLKLAFLPFVLFSSLNG